MMREQHLGIIMRFHWLPKTNETHPYDYVDYEVPVLAKMYAKRRAGYRAIGYEIATSDNKKQANQLALGGF
ncbi:MAG: hypothetical protein R6X34_12540 [Chloroflexota bacterium]